MQSMIFPLSLVLASVFMILLSLAVKDLADRKFELIKAREEYERLFGTRNGYLNALGRWSKQLLIVIVYGALAAGASLTCLYCLIYTIAIKS